MKKHSAILPGLGLVFALAAMAQPRTIYVSTTGDDTTGDGSESAPYRTIQKGIDQAADSGDTVQVTAGTYRENLVWSTKSPVLQGAGAGSTLVDGDVDEDGTGDGRCLRLTNVPNTARVEGFTFQNGKAAGGGGLYLDHSHLTVAHNTVAYNITSGGTGQGGGLYLGSSNATLDHNTISDNYSGDWHSGGGLYVSGGSPLLIGNIISGNRAFYNGGGVFLRCNGTLIGNTIEENSATGGSWGSRGGGVCILSGSPRLEGNIIRGNTADGEGGGLYIEATP